MFESFLETAHVFSVFLSFYLYPPYNAKIREGMIRVAQSVTKPSKYIGKKKIPQTNPTTHLTIYTMVNVADEMLQYISKDNNIRM